MTKWDGLNRRKFPRINFPCLIFIGGVSSQETAILTHTENIGIGGVCVIIKEDIKNFCPVKVELDLMDMGDHVKCDGRVVWNVRRSEKAQKKMLHDIGIEFQHLSDKDQQRINQAVERYSRHVELSLSDS
jgi:hypothetical protein